MLKFLGLVLGSVAFLAMSAAAPAPSIGPDVGPDIENGKYLVNISGCVTCHSVKGSGEQGYLAGGRAIKTRFGTFFTPNLTPDKTGIGGWSESRFEMALHHGRDDNGNNYYPTFPYTSFTRLSEPDVADIKAYLNSVPAIDKPNQKHEIKSGYPRVAVNFWKWLYFRPGVYHDDPKKSQALNRGIYLANGPMHCAECHTPRDNLGGLKDSMALAGQNKNEEFAHGVPNITRDVKTGIGDWSRDDLDHFFQTGETPDEDTMDGEMKEVIEETKMLTAQDRAALVEYMMSIPAIANKIE